MKFEDFFKIMHEQIRQKFPRLCDCGIIYTDEADYNSRTIEVKGHADYREIGLGRQFVRNCPPPCNTTLGNSVIFDAQTEDKFFDYIGNRKKREHRMASEVVETFRQEYNQWLASLPQVQRNIILGVGCQTIDDIFTQMPQEKIAYLHDHDVP